MHTPICDPLQHSHHGQDEESLSCIGCRVWRTVSEEGREAILKATAKPIVAFYHPHNEGLVAGVITGSGFETGSALVDTFEVDASIRSFGTEEEAITWLNEQYAFAHDDEDGGKTLGEQLLPVLGGKMIDWEE